ncbi:MAG TPA: SMC-Scp complex subunit ScpB [Verrucomicrobiae bacterium]|jgi:segregation and condensation protein B|nr:SMC-Scp complex subunit ScpB [Verrucomicrobiae bacterium]
MEPKFVIESLLFTSQKPLSIREIREILTTAAEKGGEEDVKAFRKVPEGEIENALTALEKDHAQSGRSYYLACVAGSWQFVTRPEYMPWLRTLFGIKARPPRLSQPALETLAIVAYRQPITRAEIEQIRGVAVDGVVATLLERGLIENAGRAEVVGRPMTYATTNLFLEYFGLRNLDELPSADELRRIPVEKPESLLTVEGNLATATQRQEKPGSAGESEGGIPPIVPADTETESSAVPQNPDGGSTTASSAPEAHPESPANTP